MDSNAIITFLACVAALFVFGKVLVVPIKTVLKLVINSVLGVVLIYIINFIGATYNFHIGINIVTALVVGILGVPGAGLLVILKLITG